MSSSLGYKTPKKPKPPDPNPKLKIGIGLNSKENIQYNPIKSNPIPGWGYTVTGLNTTTTHPPPHSNF